MKKEEDGCGNTRNDDAALFPTTNLNISHKNNVSASVTVMNNVIFYIIFDKNVLLDL